MPLDEVLRHGEHVMTVCNACRYCEGYCPVFPAMEQRLTFARGDLTYLANLCHNCGECLYACQYAPPHEFGINVPNTLARIRLRSYEEYAWPNAFGTLFRRHAVSAALAAIAVFTVVMMVGTTIFGAELMTTHGRGEFYAVIPHQVLIALFGGVGVFVVLAMSIAIARFWRDSGETDGMPPLPVLAKALREAFTLTHLHGDGNQCLEAIEDRRPWRRWLHHCTLYGFGLCFVSTSIAAVYHLVFGWHAPYAYTSAPVLFGAAGGVGLLIGPAGLFVLRGRRDPELGDAEQNGLDVSFILLLFASSATGLVLMVLRARAAMGMLLLVHLSCVLTLFLTMPYGKFVHGLYRTVALVKSVLDTARAARPQRGIPTPVGAPAPTYGQPIGSEPQVVSPSARSTSVSPAVDTGVLVHHKMR